MDKIVKEGWTNNDEIDYNQKLVFSDDESDTAAPPAKGKENKSGDSRRGNDRESKERAALRKEEENRAGKQLVEALQCSRAHECRFQP